MAKSPEERREYGRRWRETHPGYNHTYYQAHREQWRTTYAETKATKCRIVGCGEPRHPYGPSQPSKLRTLCRQHYNEDAQRRWQARTMRQTCREEGCVQARKRWPSGKFAQRCEAHNRGRNNGPYFAARGLTEERYHAMLAAQGGRCAICGIDAPGPRPWTRWAIDHDHQCCDFQAGYGKQRWCGRCIRGLLCSACNTGLGNFRDDPQLLEAAIGYLRRAAQENAA